MPRLALTSTLLALCIAWHGSVRASAVGFVHVESNVGGASGGHFALRLGDRVYAYNSTDDGSLVLERQTWEQFRFHYAMLGNRPLHVAYARLDAAATSRIRDGFAGAWLREGRSEARVEGLRADLEVLEALRGERHAWRAPAAGLLDASRAGARDWSLAVDARHGSGYLGARIARTERELRRRVRDATGLERHRELRLEREALVALRDGHGVAAHATAVDPTLLSGVERRSLHALRQHLREQVLDLAGSRRPDQGRVLLVALARHDALTRSLDEGHLVVVAPLDERELELTADEVARQRARIERQVRRLDRVQHAVRAGELAAGETGLWRLEARVAASAEYRRALRHGTDVRALRPRRSPNRSRELRPLPGTPRASVAPGALMAELQAARAARPRYHLVRNNCATALVETLRASLGGSTRALGAEFEPGARLGFVPAALFADLRSRARLSRVERIAPYREARSRQLGLERDWREALTVTSRVYERRASDTSFLLFTDDVFWRRPLYGAVNLAYGLAATVLGIPAAPFDRGARLASGAGGVVFSLPELVGLNIRKGSFDPTRVEPVE